MVYECGIVPARFFGTHANKIYKKRKGVISIMKKITKLIFSCAAVAAITAALGTAALADDPVPVPLVGNIEGTYNTETGVITITNYDTTSTQQTILVFKGNALDTAGDTNIEFIDQQGAKYAKAPLKEAGAAGTKYVIRIGGDGAFDEKGFLESTFTVPGGSTPSGLKVKIGDLNNDGYVDPTEDAIWALRACMELSPNAPDNPLKGTALQATDANQDEYLDATEDAILILRGAMELSAGDVGQTVDYDATKYPGGEYWVGQ